VGVVQVLEGVVQVVELANTVGPDMVWGQGQVQGLVHIVKECILVMESLLMLVELVEVGVEDKPEVLGIPMLKDPVAATVLALAMLIGIGGDQVVQVQMLMAMVVAQETVKMVGLVVVQVLDLDTAMPTPEFHIS